MTVTQSPFTNPIQWGLARDLDADTTGEPNIRGGPTTLHSIRVTNPSGGSDSHVKLYDHTNPVAGTTAPRWILPVRANTTPTIIFGTGGAPFVNGLSERCVTEAGTAGVTNPTQDVIVDFICFD